ncbi:prepilin peptidase [Blastococcus sp. PRF04-17]|uniref:prepilin peptidase n=1 Tax=Blastococcus sp. PRF04-17 TaxID=2933797 RepID=UPI001FF3EF0A|nr:A24 family peptidase [Blastococcus sp. PRF04-17]UOY03081.1 A24 family peptidase [Blastococcus sp. PRF04-17]
MTVLLALVVPFGMAVGYVVNRAAGRFPWDEPASARYAAPSPVVELVTALLFFLAVARFGLSWELPAYLFLAAVGVLLAAIDLRHRLLPNRVVVPSIGIGAGLLALAAAVEQDGPALLRAVLGAVVLFALFLVLALIAPSGLGMGDVKLAALLGLFLGWVGWQAVFVAAAASFVVQAVLALVLLATRRIGLKGQLPFGPAMLLATVLALGWSAPSLH